FSDHTRARLPMITQITAGHILPNHNADAVAVIIPAGRLHFYVLTDHIKPHLFGLLYIIPECGISWSSVEAIRPPALVERSILKQELIIQQHFLNAIFIRSHGHFSHGEITFYFIHYFSFA